MSCDGTQLITWWSASVIGPLPWSVMGCVRRGKWGSGSTPSQNWTTEMVWSAVGCELKTWWSNKNPSIVGVGTPLTASGWWDRSRPSSADLSESKHLQAKLFTEAAVRLHFLHRRSSPCIHPACYLGYIQGLRMWGVDYREGKAPEQASKLGKGIRIIKKKKCNILQEQMKGGLYIIEKKHGRTSF